MGGRSPKDLDVLQCKSCDWKRKQAFVKRVCRSVWTGGAVSCYGEGIGIKSTHISCLSLLTPCSCTARRFPTGCVYCGELWPSYSNMCKKRTVFYFTLSHIVPFRSLSTFPPFLFHHCPLSLPPVLRLWIESGRIEFNTAPWQVLLRCEQQKAASKWAAPIVRHLEQCLRRRSLAVFYCHSFPHSHFLLFISLPTCSRCLCLQSPLCSYAPLLPAESLDYKQKEVYYKHIQHAPQQPARRTAGKVSVTSSECEGFRVKSVSR